MCEITSHAERSVFETMNLELHNSLAHPHPLLEPFAHKSFDLWDMTRFFPLKYLIAQAQIERVIKEFRNSPELPVTEKDKELLENTLSIVREQCENLSMDSCVERCGQAEFRAVWGEHCTRPILAASLEELQEAITTAMRKRKFAFIPMDKKSILNRKMALETKWGCHSRRALPMASTLK
jgi:hypothetical protein